MCEPLAVAMHGVNRAEVKPGDKVVVFGCGPIGLGMLLWLIDRGVTDVVALDLSEERLERARALGVRAALNPAEVDLRAELARLHGEVPSYGRVGVGTDAYIDAAGAPNILTQVIMMAKFHARLVITAAYMKPLEFPVPHADQRDDHHHRRRLPHRNARGDRGHAAPQGQDRRDDQPQAAVPRRHEGP
ncbi:zinc-binding dehydrogenase [Novosphingobium resinovorum]